MRGRVFVDTDVLVHARDPRDPDKLVRANEWLHLLWKEERGRTSCQVLGEYYAFMIQILNSAPARDDAWDDVQHYLLWNPQPTDTEVLAGAREIHLRHMLPWRDCLIVAAAQAMDCVLLLSATLQDGAEYAAVVVRSPFSLRVSDERGAYKVRSEKPPRHRGRGRPRRADLDSSGAAD